MAVYGDSSAKTVTVVDDEPLVLDMLVRAARSWKYECRSAISADQTLEMLEKHLTPILVIDLKTPDRDGIWLVREVHRRWPEVTIVIITSTQDREAAIKCLNAGASRYLLKPMKLEEFRQALDCAGE